MDGISNIDPSKIPGLQKYAGQYVLLSAGNEIVGAGRTYQEATAKARGRNDVALFAIPEADLVLAPVAS